MVHNGYESCLGARYLLICSVYIQHTADQKGNLKFTSETKIVTKAKVCESDLNSSTEAMHISVTDFKACWKLPSFIWFVYQQL